MSRSGPKPLLPARGSREPVGRSGTRRAPWRRRPRVRLRTAGVSPKEGRGRAASRRSRVSPQPGLARPAGHGVGSACRCGPRRCRTRSPTTPRRRTPVQHRELATASFVLLGVEAATPTMLAPARRAACAWTAPMKPAPTTPILSGDRPFRPGSHPPTRRYSPRLMSAVKQNLSGMSCGTHPLRHL